MIQSKLKDKNLKKIDALIFIDTNIFLDFYRLTNNLRLDFLKIILDNKDRIILTTQTLMEYQKNRHNIIISTISEFSTYTSSKFNYPSIIRGEDSKVISELVNQIKKKHLQKVETFKEIFSDPTEKDEVFKAMLKLSDENQPFFLDEKHPQNNVIFKLAKKRFLCGYPPRKKDDTSIGDAINWEWIVECSKANESDIIIVSRDGDYGKKLDKDLIMNDWLKYEFKNRSGHNIFLTSELSKAFDMLDVKGINKETDSKRFRKEGEAQAKTVFRSTLLPADSKLLSLCRFDQFMEELLQIIKV